MIVHFGYIDPGTGSIVLQAIIGGGLGAVYVGRKFIQRSWNSVRSLVTGRSSERTIDEAGERL